MIVAIDPGKNIGIAFVSAAGELLKSEIISLEDLKTYDFPDGIKLVVGDGTSSKKIVDIVGRLEPILINEKNTSLIARDLYFKANPAKGLMRLIPTGLRSPPELIDDYAAYAIALRYLEKI